MCDCDFNKYVYNKREVKCCSGTFKSIEKDPDLDYYLFIYSI